MMSDFPWQQHADRLEWGTMSEFGIFAGIMTVYYRGDDGGWTVECVCGWSAHRPPRREHTQIALAFVAGALRKHEEEEHDDVAKGAVGGDE